MFYWGPALLIGYQPTRNARFAPSRKLVLMTLVCLALIAFLAIVQVAHVHATQADADHCQLCIVLHAVTPVAAAAPVLLLILLYSPIAIPETRPIVRSWHPSLFTRPPPRVR